MAVAYAPAASAQSWFIGGAVGDVKQHDYSVGGPIATSNDSDTGYRVFGGYKVLPWLSGVLSNVDLGTPDYDGPAFGGFTDTLDANAIDVSAVLGVKPFGQEVVTTFVTIGVFYFTQDVHYVDDSGVYDYEDSGTSFSFGFGLQARFADVWGAHLGWQRFKDVGDDDNSGHEYDRDIIELGFEYHFGR